MSEQVFFTSDNHFFHKGILKFCPETRGHARDVDEMNELMIEVWRATVRPNDRVYILGDFSFGRTEATTKILAALPGRLHLIKGNHDNWVNQDASKRFESVDDYKKIKLDGKSVVMFHYPIVEFDQMHHGAYHLYGHVHGGYSHPGRAMDVGIDARPQKDMGLWAWEDIMTALEPRPILSHHKTDKERS